MSAKKSAEGASVLLPRNVAAALPFVSRETARPVLTGVHLTPTHVYATDSYKLVRISLPKHGPQAEDFPKMNGEPSTSEIPETGVTIPASALKRALSSWPAHSSRVAALPVLNSIAVAVTDDVVRLTTTDLERTTVEVARLIREVEVPPYDELMDKYAEPEAVVYLDARFLAEIARAMLTFLGGPARRNRFRASHVIKLELFGQTKPIRFTAERDDRDQTMEALLMPVRPGDGGPS